MTHCAEYTLQTPLTEVVGVVIGPFPAFKRPDRGVVLGVKPEVINVQVFLHSCRCDGFRDYYVANFHMPPENHLGQTSGMFPRDFFQF